jgi:predicted metal-binding protein
MRCEVQKPQLRGCPRNCERRAKADSHWDFPGRRHRGDDPRARRPAVRPKPQRLAGVPGKESDLDRNGSFSAETAGVAADADTAPVTIIVCSSCRDETGSDARPRAGALLAEATRTAAEDNRNIEVRTVECLGNCKRRLSAALLRDGCWSYVFGDLTAESGPDLVAGAELFVTSEDGLIPWRGRPDSLKRGLIARIPPLTMLKD